METLQRLIFLESTLRNEDEFSFFISVLSMLTFSVLGISRMNENKAVEREKLGGIKNWNRLSHFQSGIRCGYKKITATY